MFPWLWIPSDPLTFRFHFISILGFCFCNLWTANQRSVVLVLWGIDTHKTVFHFKVCISKGESKKFQEESLEMLPSLPSLLSSMHRTVHNRLEQYSRKARPVRWTLPSFSEAAVGSALAPSQGNPHVQRWTRNFCHFYYALWEKHPS